MLPPASTLTPLVYPYTSLMSRRSRRATEPVSSSASMTTRPPTMCRPPEKRRSAVTSALRSDVLLHSTRDSSSLTIAVIAICGVPFPLNPQLVPTPGNVVPIRGRAPLLLERPDHGDQPGRQPLEIVPWRAVGLGHRCQDELGAACAHRS